MLPMLPPNLTAAEHLSPIGHPESGVVVSVDKGWLDMVVQRFGEAISAVNRLNGRIGAVKLERRCTKAQFETGAMPADCPAN